MQAFILCAILAVSQASVILHGTGASQQFRSQDNAGNYAFGYNEGHASGGTFRKESGSHGAVAGSYGLTDADGRQRVVNYVADGAGFRADIQTNEPGVEPKDPAATTINKAGLLAAAPAVHYSAVVPHDAPVHHAPVVAHHAPVVAHHAPALHHNGAFAYSTSIGHHGVAAGVPHLGYAGYGLNHGYAGHGLNHGYAGHGLHHGYAGNGLHQGYYY